MFLYNFFAINYPLHFASGVARGWSNFRDAYLETFYQRKYKTETKSMSIYVVES